MVSKLCCRSHGQPVRGARRAAMISMSRAMSREGVIARPISNQIQASWPGIARRKTRYAGMTAREHASVAGALGLAARLEQEPAALFRLVDEHLEEACGCYVFMLVGDLVRRAHVADVRLVVVHQLEQHVDRGYVILIVVLDALQLGDVTDRPDRCATDPAH